MAILILTMKKMSKSLGNFVLARDLIEKHDPKVLRFFMLSVHYRNPINFTEELLESAKTSLERIETAYHNLGHRRKASMDLREDNKEWLARIEDRKKRFEAEMDDDFNTANAISILFDLSKEANVYVQEEQTATEVIDAFRETIDSMLQVLGIDIKNEEEELLDEIIEALIAERNEARKNRNFARADEIRDQLKNEKKSS